MTAVTFNQIGRLKNYDLANIPVTATTIFTASKALNETVIDILVSNKSAIAKKVTVQKYRAVGALTYSVVTDFLIPANSQFRCDYAMQMFEGDQIKMIAETASTLDGSILVAEGVGRGG
jgi:hypothetical protein